MDKLLPWNTRGSGALQSKSRCSRTHGRDWQTEKDRKWCNRTFRAISGGFREQDRLQQGFAALAFKLGPLRSKPLIFWIFSDLTAIFRTKDTLSPT
jgi:hypothetical protein